jgi:hypothetical protein
MGKRCENCVYAGEVSEGERKILICVNKPEREGELSITTAEEICDNYFKKRWPVDRPEVQQPENEEIRYIALTKGKFAIVDKRDYEELNKYRWHALESQWGFYAVRTGRKSEGRRGEVIWMHREIAGNPKGKLVDHKNGNTLDDRIENLRAATRGQNNCNRGKCSTFTTSKYKGVSRERGRKKWQAGVRCKGRFIRIGYFDDEEAAARAYDKAAKKMHGKFARLNFRE